MCAIFGIFSSNRIDDQYRITFKKAFALTKHRGPTGTNELFLKNALLGFHRLSIVGKNNGSQPILNEDESLALLCNGEIFNHKELRQKLINQHRFRTDSDCEIILHLYEEYADNFVSMLKGQFAFLLYDLQNNKLLLARDRFGINPLFYANHNQNWLIASEIKSITAIEGNICQRLDTTGLMETYYLYGPTPPRTCFENIFQVKPGHLCVIDLQKNKVINQMKYWKLPEKTHKTDDEIERELEHLLIQSVKRRKQADDANIAVYLSGGLDSSTIATLLSRDIKTESFCVQFHSDQFDESVYQKQVAEYLSIKRHSLHGDNLLDDYISQVVWHNEHPLIRTAPLPLYLLSKKVSDQSFKVVHCGEGADEFMLGYPVFNKNVSSVESKFAELHSIQDLFISVKPAAQLITSMRRNIANNFNLSLNSIRTTQLLETFTKLSRFLLVQQGDRMSMSHGVEQRFPYLDEDLFDFLFSIPEKQFLRLFNNKYLLRKIMRNVLPISVVNRPKQGYLAPMAEELYASLIVSQAMKKILDGTSTKLMENYYNHETMRQLAKKYRAHTLSNPEAIAVLLIVSTILHAQHFG